MDTSPIALLAANSTSETGTATNYFRRDSAATYVRDTYGMPCSSQWLAKLAVIGGGPAYRKAGRIPIYEQAALDEWANGRLSKPVRSTAEHRMLGAA